MGATLKEIEKQALQLPLKERSELAHRLIVSLDGEPEDSPEAIAQAWLAKSRQGGTPRGGAVLPGQRRIPYRR